MQTVITNADCFVYAKVKSCDEEKGISIEIIRSLGGKAVKRSVEVTDFYLLALCSKSEGHGPEFNFTKGEKCYFFLKKGKKGKYSIATPTTGFAHTEEGNVYATYRHSYHQTLVPEEMYEKTMTAIFNYYHQLPYDETTVRSYIDQYINQEPAGFEPEEINTFFAQHVALESIYHLQLSGYYEQTLPFLADTSNFHNQVSAARALISNNTPECQQQLLQVLRDTSRSEFLKVMCVETLIAFTPKELKSELEILAKDASDESNSFGGNIMDPRVCTGLSSVRSALELLISKL